MNNNRNIKKEKNNLFLARIISAIILILFIISFFFYYNHSIIKDGTLIENNLSKLIYQIESVEVKNNNLIITGWAFRNGEGLTNVDEVPNMRIVMVETDNHESLHYYPAKYGIERAEVADYFNGEQDYTNCGFEAEINISKLNLDNKDYEIAIQQNERTLPIVLTKTYIHQGQIMYADPAIYVPLDVIGTDLEEICDKGILRVYRSDIGMYVYQYNNQLFWIADRNYPFKEGWEMLNLLVETTQAEKLPDERVAQGVGYDNLSHLFSDTEITNALNCGRYRVSVLDIPTKYAVTVFETGYFAKGEWVWSERFIPIHEFE